MPIEKQCIDCGYTLPIRLFNKNKAYSDGHFKYCKKCSAERYRKWTLNNPGVAGQRTRVYRAKNPIQAQQSAMEWRLNNLERIRQTAKLRYEKNKERIALKNKEWAKANPEKIAAIKRKYRISEKGKMQIKKNADIPANKQREERRVRAKNRAKVMALTDGYVAETMMVKLSDVPIELIELQRIRLQIKRQIKERK